MPAEKATIGVMDYLHTRIQTTESISTQLSSFMLDLRQVRPIAFSEKIWNFLRKYFSRFRNNLSILLFFLQFSSQKYSLTSNFFQMYSCLYNSTPRTLIVIDEFGKGTADVDGLSLLSACVQDFLDREVNCPHILVSTHFHTLLSLIPQSPLIKLQVKRISSTIYQKE